MEHGQSRLPLTLANSTTLRPVVLRALPVGGWGAPYMNVAENPGPLFSQLFIS